MPFAELTLDLADDEDCHKMLKEIYADAMNAYDKLYAIESETLIIYSRILDR